MSEIKVGGIDHLYAQLSGSDNNPYLALGVHQIGKHRLWPLFGENQNLARAEAVPMLVHNAFEILWATENGNHPIEVAMLGLATNALLPELLKHAHPQAEQQYNRPVYLAEIRRPALKGLEKLHTSVEKYDGLYGKNQAVYLQNMAYLKTILQHVQPNARDWRIDKHGTIKHKSK